MESTLQRGKRGRTKTYSALDFAIGAFIGVLFFVLVYGVSTLNVTYDSWIYCGYMEEDVIQRYAGWMYYRASGWTWPLTVAQNLAVPYGTSIVFTDSLPLAAMVCKLFSPILPATFQYFGWVNLFNFALQGGFAMLLVRQFKTGRVYGAVAAALFVCAPVFVERAFRHDSLGCQWLIIAALLYYFVARHRARFPFAGFFTIAVLCVLIHTYFLPMVYAILAAALLERMVKERKVLRYLLFLAGCFGGNLLAGYATGMLTRGGDGGGSGFGSYSMNLNALWNPTSFDWYAGNGEQGGSLAWSRLIPVQPQNYHQYDGFNYLGAGVLLALLAIVVYGAVRAVLALRRRQYAVLRRAGAFLKSHVWLVVVCACLSLFALSPVVVWNGTTLLSVPLPDMLMHLGAIFRSSGRLFWPVGYLLLLAVVVFTARVPRPKLRTVLLALVLALQLFDTSATLVQKHNYFASGPLVKEDTYTSEGWRFMAENYDTVLCLGNIFDYNLAAGIIRYNPDVQTNLILANRGDFETIEYTYTEMQQALVRGEKLPAGTMYIASDEATFHTIMSGLHPQARGYIVGDLYIFASPLPGNPLPEVLPVSAGG